MIHGTNKDFGIGMRVSAGCIRMDPSDIEWLFDKVQRGEKVRVEKEGMRGINKRMTEIAGRIRKEKEERAVVVMVAALMMEEVMTAEGGSGCYAYKIFKLYR